MGILRSSLVLCLMLLCNGILGLPTTIDGSIQLDKHKRVKMGIANANCDDANVSFFPPKFSRQTFVYYNFLFIMYLLSCYLLYIVVYLFCLFVCIFVRVYLCLFVFICVCVCLFCNTLLFSLYKEKSTRKLTFLLAFFSLFVSFCPHI